MHTAQLPAVLIATEPRSVVEGGRYGYINMAMVPTHGFTDIIYPVGKITLPISLE